MLEWSYRIEKQEVKMKTDGRIMKLLRAVTKDVQSVERLHCYPVDDRSICLSTLENKILLVQRWIRLFMHY